MRVLMVEDDPTLREVLREVLSDQGWHVVAASRGEEALQRAAQERFDLILADIRMDGLNGLDTIEQARELQPGIGSIVVSGYASEEETLRAVKLNVAGYLKKPFQMTELMELITGYLAQREERTRRERDLRAAREAFLWALEGWGLQAGGPARAAELARGLAQAQGFPEELARQLSLGALLRDLSPLWDKAYPSEVGLTLAAFPLLQGALQAATSAEVALAARQVCQNLGEGESWPAEPPSSWSPTLREAYRVFVSGQSLLGARDGAESAHGLFSLGRTLEHAGDLEGAEGAYDGAARLAGISPLAVQSLLGKARLALARGHTGNLEASVASVLKLAESLGPVSLALTELDAAEVLRRAGHPATAKLLDRAAKSLALVGLGVPWARAVLARHSLTGGADEAPLEKALAQLSARAQRWDVMEQLESLLPDLLQLDGARGLCAELVRDDPQQVAALLRRGALAVPSREALLRLIEGELSSVPAAILTALQEDSEEEIRSASVALGARLGRSESRPVLRVRSLGSLDVRVGDERLDDKAWRTQKTKHLFARLVESAPRALSVERVMEEFWPDSGEGARNNLNTATSLMRRLLSVAGMGLDPVSRLADTVSLNPELPLWHDADELEKASASAQRALAAGHLETALAHFSTVARLYRGDFLEGCYMDWAVERRNQLENRAAVALEHLAAQRCEQHRYREALEYGLALLGLQPENTLAHETVMKCYIGTDQHQRAVSHYEGHEARLAVEGQEPPTELLRAYQMARYGFQQGHGLDL